jgi:hypothetical protein
MVTPMPTASSLAERMPLVRARPSPNPASSATTANAPSNVPGVQPTLSWYPRQKRGEPHHGGGSRPQLREISNQASKLRGVGLSTHLIAFLNAEQPATCKLCGERN